MHCSLLVFCPANVFRDSPRRWLDRGIGQTLRNSCNYRMTPMLEHQNARIPYCHLLLLKHTNLGACRCPHQSRYQLCSNIYSFPMAFSREATVAGRPYPWKNLLESGNIHTRFSLNKPDVIKWEPPRDCQIKSRYFIFTKFKKQNKTSH